jgi:RNA polymerase subunit RPABC4/transcription elongation factor Spt4
MFNWDAIENMLLLVAAVVGAFGAALWLSLILWAFRDIRKRSRDPVAQIFAAAVVAILNLPGLVIYLILRPPETLAEAYERSLEEEALLQSIEEKAICPGCGRAARDDWQVCPFCHTKLKKVCVTCSALLDLGWNICPFCASSQLGYGRAEQAPAAAPNAAPAEVEPQRPPSPRPKPARIAPPVEAAAQEVPVPLIGDAAPRVEKSTDDNGTNPPVDESPPSQRDASARDRRTARRRRTPARSDTVLFIEDDDF